MAAGAPSAASPAGASVEDLIAKDKALNEANAWVQELEKNRADLESCLNQEQEPGQPAATSPAAVAVSTRCSTEGSVATGRACR